MIRRPTKSEQAPMKIDPMGSLDKGEIMNYIMKQVVKSSENMKQEIQEEYFLKLAISLFLTSIL